MSTTVSYNGNTIATVDNETVTLATAGTWMGDDLTLTDSSLVEGSTYYQSANTYAYNTISFNVDGEPERLFVYIDPESLDTYGDGSTYYVAYIVWDGTNCNVVCLAKGAGDGALYLSRTVTYTYNNGVVTISNLRAYNDTVYFKGAVKYTCKYFYRG